MTDPKMDSILDEANRLFLKGKLKEAIEYYDKILKENPKHISSLNNKGYALSKLKDFDDAMKCYDEALDNLEHAILQGTQYKVKAKKSKLFEKLSGNSRFQKLIS